MTTISKLEFGKNLRPSTVDTMNKINEIIGVVNGLDAATVTTDINTLKSNVTTLQGQMTTANTNIATNTSNISTLDNDMKKVKVTLYTPLSSNDATD